MVTNSTRHEESRLSGQHGEAGTEARKRGCAETALSSFLFMTGLGGALGLGLAGIEKVILHYSGSNVSEELYALLFIAAGCAGLAAGAIAGAGCAAAMAAGANRRIAFAAAGAVLVGLAAQAHAHYHGDVIYREGTFLLGAEHLSTWLAGAAATAAVLAVAARSRRPATALAAGAAAILTGLASARYFGKESVFNVASMPLVLFAAASAAVEAFSGRVTRFAGPVLAAAMPAALIIYAAHQGLRPAVVIDAGHESDAARSAMLAGKPNVIIIVLDTLRPDHVSGMGYERKTTPRIDEFLKECTVYTQAKSVSSWTLAAHAAMYTGLWPRTNGAHFAEARVESSDLTAIAYPLSPNVPTLAEIVRDKGYATAGVAANYSWLGAEFGMERGYEYYFCAPRYLQETVGDRDVQPVSPMLDALVTYADRRLDRNYDFRKPYYTAPEITAKALGWLERRRGEPFLLFLNYLDPHDPYNPPPPYDTMFPGKRSARGAKVGWENTNRGVMTGKADLDGALRDEVIGQYDGEIAFMDRHVGRFLDALKEKGLYDDSLIVLASDHGESFGDHRYVQHGVSLYEDETAMLLAVKRPGQKEGKRDDSPAQIVDVTPTVLAELRIPAPMETEGQPLGSVTHPIVTELYPPLGRAAAYGDRFRRKLLALYSGDRKIILSTTSPPELYDLAKDPQEETNLWPAAPDAGMLDSLMKWDSRHPPAAPTSRGTVDASLLTKLKSIGYIQ